MDNEKNLFIALILIGLVLLFVWSPMYQKVFYPEQYRAKQEMLEKARQMPAESSPADDSSKPVDPVIPDSPRTESRVLTPSFSPSEMTAVAERSVVVETDLYRAEMSSKGGTIKQWQLKSYLGPDGEPVHLFPDQSVGTLGLTFISPDDDTLNTAEWHFNFDADSVIVLQNDQSQRLEFVHQLADGKAIRKLYVFENGKYDISLQVNLLGMGSIVSEKMYFIGAPTGLVSTEKHLSDDMYYAKAAVTASGTVNSDFGSVNKLYREDGAIDWVGVRTKYFLLAIAPQNQKGQFGQVQKQELLTPQDPKVKWKKFSVQLAMPYLGGNQVSDNYLIYLGPLEYDVVKSYGLNFEKFMDFGFKLIQPFSHAILWSFKKIHTFVPNYGWVLIIFSILIKIIVTPLTNKSYQSMKKMQALQPKMVELKQKFQKDPQRLNKETMRLYKEEGVNPMSGCLPVLLQMPLLWALFIVFRSTIELRHQPFIWWMQDLSNPDTIATLPFSIPIYGDKVNILPLFMGATMLIQQKMTTMDPKQKALVYIMPIFFTLLFNSFPSGLNLYYALFNILSIAQQIYMDRKAKRQIIKK